MHLKRACCNDLHQNDENGDFLINRPPLDWLKLMAIGHWSGIPTKWTFLLLSLLGCFISYDNKRHQLGHWPAPLAILWRVITDVNLVHREWCSVERIRLVWEQVSESKGCCMFISVTKCALYCHETYILKYSLERQDEVSRYVMHWSQMPWGPKFVKISSQWGPNF